MVGNDCLSPSFWSNRMQGHHYRAHRAYIMKAFTVLKQLLFYPSKPHSTPSPFCTTSPLHTANPSQCRGLVFVQVNILHLLSCQVKDRLWSPSYYFWLHLYPLSQLYCAARDKWSLTDLHTPSASLTRFTEKAIKRKEVQRLHKSLKTRCDACLSL